MIVDRLANWASYRGIASRWMRALEFLRESDPASLALGRLELDGDRLFALVQDYTTKPADQCRWEAHRRYCDIQYVAQGTERIGVANLERMQVERPYDADRDVAFFTGSGDFLTLPAGSFAIFTPQDVHMPCLVADRPEMVRKVVVKALLDDA
jgi:YhcH/YjgK/YiaL family protein